MTEAVITSASRMTAELRRLKQHFGPKLAVYAAVNDAYAFVDGQGRWVRGVRLYDQLVQRTFADLDVVIDGGRRESWKKIVDPLGNLMAPESLHRPATEHYNTCVTQRVRDHLEMLDELLRREGRSMALEQARAADVARELEALISEIQANPESSIDIFLVTRLTELRSVLENFHLYGPEGARDVVARILGGLVIEAQEATGISDTTNELLPVQWTPA